MKKLVVGILLLIMAAIPQYTQAATYNGNIIQNVNEYVFSDSRVNYYIDYIFVSGDGFFSVMLYQQLRNPNDIVTKAMVYGNFNFYYGWDGINEWTFVSGSAAGAEISRGNVYHNSVAQSVFNVAYPYAEQIMSKMRAQAKHEAERERQQQEQERLEQEKMETERREKKMREDAVSYFKAGEALAESGDYTEAIKSYKAAIKCNPEYQEAYFKLGCVFEKLGEYEEALKNYEKCLEINPNNLEAKEGRDRIKKH